MKYVKRFVIFSLVFIMTIYLINADTFGYNYLDREVPEELINYSLIPTVNNTLFWDGNAFDIDRWLLIDGSNANQNIDISPYNLTVDFFIGDGSLLTNLPTQSFTYPHDQDLNTTDSPTFQNLNVTEHIETVTINASNITTRNINVTENSTIYLGGVPISSATDFDGKQIVTFGDAFVNASGYFGDGGFLDNISFVNGSVTAISFNGSDFYGGNFYGIYDWVAEPNWLNFNGTYLYFNETHLNNTILSFINNINTSELNFSSISLNNSIIYDWSEINWTVGANSVTHVTGSQSGTYSVVLPTIFDFEITRIIVTPTNVASSDKYRFSAYELGGGKIEADIIKHDGIWEIEKSYALENQITLNFTEISPANDFTIEIIYLENQN